MTMKILKLLTCAALAAAFVSAPLLGFAAEVKKDVKPYTLTTCVVSGEKLGGMGDAYVFTHEGQEIKLCCKGCLKTFNKDPKKFLKKIEDAGKEKK